MRRNGFSLIEIIISVSIMVLLMGLITFRNNSDSIILGNTANEITSAIRAVKQIHDAGDKNAYFSIVQTSQGRFYRITQRKNGTNTVTVHKEIHKNIRVSKKVINSEEYSPDNNNSGYTDGGAISEIKISFSGVTGTGTSILLSSKNCKTQYKITIIPTSARIHLYKFKSQT